MKDYEKRLNISINGDNTTLFYNKQGLAIAKGYNRIVIGDRGPYVEFNETQIKMKSTYIPENELWRVDSDNAFYVEYRTKDESYTKIYYQKKVVDYADYLINHYYISPFDLMTDTVTDLVGPIKPKNSFQSNKFF